VSHGVDRLKPDRHAVFGDRLLLLPLVYHGAVAVDLGPRIVDFGGDGLAFLRRVELRIGRRADAPDHEQGCGGDRSQHARPALGAVPSLIEEAAGGEAWRVKPLHFSWQFRHVLASRRDNHFGAAKTNSSARRFGVRTSNVSDNDLWSGARLELAESEAVRVDLSAMLRAGFLSLVFSHRTAFLGEVLPPSSQQRHCCA
jgi:hypothetical protein